MLDVACSLLLLLMPIIVGAGYLLHVALRGPVRSERVKREGASRLVAKGVMEMFYWALAPLGALSVRLGIGANAITLASLVLGLAAGALVGLGHLGAGGLLAAVSAAFDGLDGVVARLSGRASDAGEVLDAAVDRYNELALLGGLAVYLRGSVWALVLVMLAIAASFMISYSTAKAEALQVTPPRGSMRRAERAVLLIGGVAVAPLAPRVLGLEDRDLPLIVALGAIAILGNLSAVQRLCAVARLVRAASASEAPPESARLPPVSAARGLP
jgi:phosphatidylglycerophosphate synthase